MNKPRVLICKDGVGREELKAKCNSLQYSFVIYEVSRKHAWTHLLFLNESMANVVLSALKKLTPQKISGKAYNGFVFDYVYLLEASLGLVLNELKENQHLLFKKNKHLLLHTL
jgi:hypothetical protein